MKTTHAQHSNRALPEAELRCERCAGKNEYYAKVGKLTIYGNRGIGMTEDETRQNWAFIVRACNSHAELVGALENAEFLLRQLAINWKEAGSMKDSSKNAADMARAALALAKGGQ